MQSPCIDHYMTSSARPSSVPCLYIHVQAHSSLGRPWLMPAHDVRHRPKLPTSFFRVYQALALLERVRTQLGQLCTTHASRRRSPASLATCRPVCTTRLSSGEARLGPAGRQKKVTTSFSRRERAPPALSISCSGEAVPTVNTSSVTTVVQLGEMCETPVV